MSEALEKGLVVVKETGNVQELSLENRSQTTTVFLNAGDIVKGGRQDRTVRDETLDVEAKETWIHKSFVHRGTDAVVVPLDRESSRRGPQSQR